MTLEEIENLQHNLTTTKEAFIYGLHLAITAPTEQQSVAATAICEQLAQVMTALDVRLCQNIVDKAHANAI